MHEVDKAELVADFPRSRPMLGNIKPNEPLSRNSKNGRFEALLVAF